MLHTSPGSPVLRRRRGCAHARFAGTGWHVVSGHIGARRTRHILHPAMRDVSRDAGTSLKRSGAPGERRDPAVWLAGRSDRRLSWSARRRLHRVPTGSEVGASLYLLMRARCVGLRGPCTVDRWRRGKRFGRDAEAREMARDPVTFTDGAQCTLLDDPNCQTAAEITESEHQTETTHTNFSE